jgi:lysozyme family protein
VFPTGIEVSLSTLEILLSKIIVVEGGIKDVGDGKGVTRFGQTPDWLTTFNLPAPETPEQALANYVKWAQITKLSEVCCYRDALSEILLSFSIHNTHLGGIKALQRAVKVKADGVIGPITLAAVHDAQRHTLAVKVLASYQRLIGLALKKPLNTRFASGWLNRLASLTELLTLP